MYTNKTFEVTIGADPEFFLFDKGTKKPVSAHGLIPGSKTEPHPLRNGAVQLDGTAIEFNIEPCTSSQMFVNNINSVLEQIRGRVPQNYDFNFTPCVHYDKEYFDTIIPSSCKELGCDPDYDAYTGKPNPRPNRVGTMATGAGHIHIGWTGFNDVDPFSPGHFEDCCELTKVLDKLFGFVESMWDNDTERRAMYGKPGAFRPKKYGMEYRTLSNAWVRYPNLYHYIYQLATLGFHMASLGIKASEIVEINLEEVSETIIRTDRMPADLPIGAYFIRKSKEQKRHTPCFNILSHAALGAWTDPYNRNYYHQFKQINAYLKDKTLPKPTKTLLESLGEIFFPFTDCEQIIFIHPEISAIRSKITGVPSAYNFKTNPIGVSK